MIGSRYLLTKAHIQVGQIYPYSNKNWKKLGGHHLFYFGEDAG